MGINEIAQTVLKDFFGISRLKVKLAEDFGLCYIANHRDGDRAKQTHKTEEEQMLGRLFKSLKKDANGSVHPDFPDLPLNMRLNGLVKFKASSKTYFLLNDGKIQSAIPEEDAMIKAVSSMQLFDLNVYRAYMDSQSPETILQVNCDGKDVLDVLLFNKKWEFVMENDASAQKEWRNMIGWKDMAPPDSPMYFRDWSVPVEEYGEMVSPLRFYERYFENPEKMTEITNEAMLYVRQIEGGKEEDIEYLLASFRTGLRRYRVEVWTGVVIGAGGVDIL